MPIKGEKEDRKKKKKTAGQCAPNMADYVGWKRSPLTKDDDHNSPGSSEITSDMYDTSRKSYPHLGKQWNPGWNGMEDTSTSDSVHIVRRLTVQPPIYAVSSRDIFTCAPHSILVWVGEIAGRLGSLAAHRR